MARIASVTILASLFFAIFQLTFNVNSCLAASQQTQCSDNPTIVIARKYLNSKNYKLANSTIQPLLQRKRVSFCDSVVFAEALLIEGAVQLNSGTLIKALTTLRISKFLIETTTQDPCLLTKIHNNIGTCFYNLEQFDSSNIHYASAYKYSHNCLNNDDIIQVLINWSSLNSYLENNNKALQLAKEALSKVKTSSRKQLFEIHYILGNCYYGIMDYDKAERHYLLALSFSESVSSSEYIMSSLNLISTYTISSKLSHAKKQAGKLAKTKLSTVDQIYLFRAWAEIHRAEGDSTAELLAQLQTIKLTQPSEKNIESSYEEAISYIYYTEALIHYKILDSLKTSIVRINKSIHLLNNSVHKQSNDIARAYSILGKIYTLINKPFYSLLYFDSSFAAIGVKLKEDVTLTTGLYQNELTSISDAIYLNIRTDLATSLYANYRKRNLKDDFTLQIINNICQKSLTLIQNIKKYLTYSKSKQVLSQSNTELFYLAMDVAYKCYIIRENTNFLGDHIRASELLKAQNLKEHIIEKEALEIQGIPESIINMEEHLSDSLEYFRSRIENTYIEQEVQLLKINEYKLKVKKDSLIQIIQNNYPKYYLDKYDLREYDISTMIKNIGYRKSIIIINEDLEYLYVIHLSRSNISFIRLEKNNILLNNINQYLSIISNDPLIDTCFDINRKAFIESSKYIYSKIIKPIELQLKHEITIVNCDALAQFPFECLVTTPEKTKFSTVKYLINSHVISYANSINFIYKDIPTLNKLNALVIAPDYTSNDNSPSYSLPYQSAELNEIIKALPNSMILTGNKITKAQISSLIDSFSIIHFSTHTHLSKYSDSTSLILGSEIDNMPNHITLAEIKRLKWKNKGHVILNSCNSGIGQLIPSEGIQSLGRAFLYAGASTIIISLWESNDYSSASLLGSFYKYLDDNPSSALSIARQEYIIHADEITSHPFYWCSSVIYLL
jgi:hypothetical protein